MPKTIKLSYSILNTWANHDFEKAVAYYLGKDLPTTPAMELGSLKHKLWENYTLEHKALAPELGGDKLTNPEPEIKREKLIPLGDKYQILLRGIPDLIDGTTLYEYKVGLTPASKCVDSLQCDYYRFLCPQVNIAIYLCFNPYTGTYTKGIKYLSDKNAEQALEHIITFGSELIDYLASQRLIFDYKPEVYAV